MSGAIYVTHTADWLTPFEVKVADDDTGSVTKMEFTSPRRAQEFALGLADRHPDFTLVYRDLREADEQPRRISTEEFLARMPKVCKGKCRESKPLNRFRQIFHTNRATNPGAKVMHGWADDCLDCEGES